MDWLDFQEMSDCTQHEYDIDCPHCGEEIAIINTPGVCDDFECPLCSGQFSHTGSQPLQNNNPPFTLFQDDEVMKITKFQVMEKIAEAQSHTFGAVFTKKDGSERKMSCRRGVRKGVSGVGMKFDPISKGLLPVYDMNVQTEDGKGAFRMLNLNTLKTLTINKKVYEVV